MATSADLFGEEYQGLDVLEFPTPDHGKGYAIRWNNDDPTETYISAKVLIIYPNGDRTEVDIQSEQEYELWTTHLRTDRS